MASETHIIYARAEKATSVAISKFRFVEATSSRVKLSTETAIPYGVSMTATTARDALVQVIMIGVAPVEASTTAAISKGARIGCGASGYAIAAIANTPVGGIALATAAGGNVFPILLGFGAGRTTV